MNTNTVALLAIPAAVGGLLVILLWLDQVQRRGDRLDRERRDPLDALVDWLQLQGVVTTPSEASLTEFEVSGSPIENIRIWIRERDDLGWDNSRGNFSTHFGVFFLVPDDRVGSIDGNRPMERLLNTRYLQQMMKADAIKAVDHPTLDRVLRLRWKSRSAHDVFVGIERETNNWVITDGTWKMRAQLFLMRPEPMLHHMAVINKIRVRTTSRVDWKLYEKIDRCLRTEQFARSNNENI